MATSIPFKDLGLKSSVSGPTTCDGASLAGCLTSGIRGSDPREPKASPVEVVSRCSGSNTSVVCLELQSRSSPHSTDDNSSCSAPSKLVHVRCFRKQPAELRGQ
mmetsp:Transcript_39907/g.109816  ORF Transcript_39907/g.109816 Transcript_39907/m.109816 type:complete len:104 (-) Transcript_39907:264-575(-)